MECSVMKIIVFDLGGTLMQYVGMPYSWVDFYYQGFDAIIRKYNCHISKEQIEKAMQILVSFNPRISKRETEYTAEYIFEKVFESWKLDIPTRDCIEIFWSGLKLNAEIFPDTIDVLSKLKEKGYIIATLTDLPNAMPDNVFKQDISELIPYFDCYVSSELVGYRKPNCKGLQMVAEQYGVRIDELIFVGDEEKDRSTAVNAGCRFVHICRAEASDNSINNLYELLSLLETEEKYCY